MSLGPYARHGRFIERVACRCQERVCSLTMLQPLCLLITQDSRDDPLGIIFINTEPAMLGCAYAVP